MTRTFRVLIAALVLALVAPAVHGVPRVVAVDYLDPAFGTGGKASLSFDNSMSATAVALQVDGKIVVAGGEWQFAVARFKPDGTPDTTFDGDGHATTTAFGVWAAPHAVAVQSDGKI